MKRAAFLLVLVAMFFSGLAAANAIATTVNGSVQVQTGSAAPRLLRQGDTVHQGDTVVTGPGASTVLRFEDGQIAAMTQNSRMTVTAYQYDPAHRTGNVLLSLITGGMRAITGLIGRNAPERVSYRAATATIGIRGTDVTFVTDNAGNIVVTVTEGVISFTFNGRTIEVPAGQGVNARTDGTFQQGAIQQILNQAPADVITAIGGLDALNGAVQDAAAGTARTITIPPSTGTTPGSTPGGASGGVTGASPS